MVRRGSICGTHLRKKGVTSLVTAYGDALELSLWYMSKKSIGLLMTLYGGALELSSWDARKKRYRSAYDALRWYVGAQFVECVSSSVVTSP